MCEFVTTEQQRADVQADVDVHGQRRAVGVREPHGAGRRPRASLEGQVRLPARVDHERVLQPAQALQHHEGRLEPRLQGLRHRHASQLAAQVRLRVTTPTWSCASPEIFHEEPRVSAQKNFSLFCVHACQNNTKKLWSFFAAEIA